MREQFPLSNEMNTNEDGRRPSPLLLRTSFILLALMQIFNLSLTSALILTLLVHRRLRTIPNLLTGNSSVAIFFYSSMFIGQLIVSEQSEDSRREGWCILLAYCTVAAASAVCYSYLVTGTSQLFFNVLFRRRYLLTLPVHWATIALSWLISALLPLTLYLSGKSHTLDPGRTERWEGYLGLLQYSVETNMCAAVMSIKWTVFLFMGLALGVPWNGIIIIYVYIIRSTRRVQTTAVHTVQRTNHRDLRVVRHMVTLVGILGTAGLPSLVVIVWNTFFASKAPVVLYFVSILNISFFTNIQISFIFAMNRRLRSAFWKDLRQFFSRLNIKC